MLKRLVKGEQEYKGLWLTKPMHEFEEEIAEELDDAHVYQAMRSYRHWHNLL